VGTQAAFVVHPNLRKSTLNRPADAMLEEACLLARAIGLTVVHREVVSIIKLQPGLYFGQGVANRLAELADDFSRSADPPLLVINASLSPVQQRNLEIQIKAKVIDRTQLILEIFGARARSRPGTLQVELAALNFQRSRLVRSWTHLERQRGGGGFLGGPGERQIELDRRILKEKLIRIKEELKQVAQTRKIQRRNRTQGETLTVALVGYTNAGKSSLFNRLTGASVLSKDMLFSTLDPKMRKFELVAGHKVVLADTVGFISALPTELVEAFKSTLEEVVYADALIHVHDASSQWVAEEAADVTKILVDLGMSIETQNARVVHVLNKADLLNTDCEQVDSLRSMFPDGIFVSAIEGYGFEDLLACLENHLVRSTNLVKVTLNLTDGEARAWLHQNSTIRSSYYDNQWNEILLVSIDAIKYARFCLRWPSIFITLKV
jgi:GTP-binding protein HflX